jgi:hypothetical protein
MNNKPIINQKNQLFFNCGGGGGLVPFAASEDADGVEPQAFPSGRRVEAD